MTTKIETRFLAAGLAAGFMVLAAAGPAAAQDAQRKADEMIERLAPPPEAAPATSSGTSAAQRLRGLMPTGTPDAGRTRGVEIGAGQPAVRTRAVRARGLSRKENVPDTAVTGMKRKDYEDTEEQIVIDTERSVEEEVFFDYDSAELRDIAKRQLESIGIALSSNRLKRLRFLIAGHTDAAGTADYNQELSERRADAVRAYLIDNFNLDPSRIYVVGYGFEHLKDPTRPRSAVNRRVEISLITERRGAAN